MHLNQMEMFILVWVDTVFPWRVSVEGTDLSSLMQTEGMQVQVSGLQEMDWASPGLCVSEKAVCP